MADRYRYRIQDGPGDLTLIWQLAESGVADTVAVDEHGRLLAFADEQALSAYCRTAGWEPLHEAASTLDLAAVRRWVRQPGLDLDAHRGRLLDAWNLFEDLERSLPGGPGLPPQYAAHDGAYRRLFDGEQWSAADEAAARSILRAGLDLWDHAVATATATTTVAAPRP
ncbi:hypothetical protein [Kitasatospora sp. NPDC050543]|uniref:hypothetical protein n=1 Tax=Kitasatospora sp. NPDC050543 TaxID=3364054 RepID=UPI0037BCD6AD